MVGASFTIIPRRPRRRHDFVKTLQKLNRKRVRHGSAMGASFFRFNPSTLQPFNSSTF